MKSQKYFHDVESSRSLSQDQASSRKNTGKLLGSIVSVMHFIQDQACFNPPIGLNLLKNGNSRNLKAKIDPLTLPRNTHGHNLHDSCIYIMHACICIILLVFNLS